MARIIISLNNEIAKKMRIEAIKRYRITESLSKLIEESFAASATIMLVI